MARIATALVLLAALATATPAGARGRDPYRLEWAPFPAIGGNSDMGLMLGVQPIFAKFDPAYNPYRFRIQSQVAMSIKWWDGRGVYVPVHMHFLRVDLPGLAGGKLRLWVMGEYNQRNNAGYFGLGNASRWDPSPSSPPPGETVLLTGHKRYQYREYEPLLRLNARVALGGHLYLLSGVRFTWHRTEVYDGSILAADRGKLDGLGDHLTAQFAAAVQFDSRDHETTPASGFLAEAQVRGSPGLGTGLHFGGVTIDGRSYVPLYGEWLVLATRVFGDILYGNVPFYELSRASSFENRQYPGGRDGFRGVPEGRYHGRIKLGADVELRSMFWTFYLFDERFRLGALLLADAGRVWSDFTPDPAVDGTGAGIRWGAGAGIRFQVGETVLARFDFSYSPDAASGGLPIGIYVDIGHVF